MKSTVLSTSHNSTLMIQISSSENRSISPLSSTSSSREIRGIKLFRAISRKLSRKSQEDYNFNEDLDSRSSSTDSCSSTSAGRSPRGRKIVSCNFRNNVNSQRMSSSSTDTISDTHSIKHKHSTSAENFKRAFQNLTLSSRSQSCNNGKEMKRKHPKKSSSPKKILRAPVTYTYVKGLSGLSQRIPRTQTNLCYNGNCGYSVQYMGSLNR